MNNKGFTLVELLAVMVILISISLVTVGGITASLEKRDIKNCEEQQELAIGAAKIYFSLNDVDKVYIYELKQAGYFNDNQKIDKLKDTDYIKISTSNDKYIYSGTTCS